MTWSVVWSSPAVRDLRGLDRQGAQRVREAVARLARSGYGDLRRLRGRERGWRLRVGDWRVRLALDIDTRTIHVYRVLHRREAYRQ